MRAAAVAVAAVVAGLLATAAPPAGSMPRDDSVTATAFPGHAGRDSAGRDDSVTATAFPGHAGRDSAGRDDSVTLVVYDSFPLEGTTLNDALAGFTEATGIDVQLVVAGDTGTMVSKAVLTAGNPEGDVMWGVDNTYLSRALDADVFEPYVAAGIDDVPAALRAAVPDGEATPVDFGDVCVNYDIGWFADAGLDPPGGLDALADPAYRGLARGGGSGIVVAGAGVPARHDRRATATDAWTGYWTRLVDNGVAVIDGWTEAYYDRFSGAGDGDRPLVVSYGSSPPAEVIFADPPVDAPTTGVIADTCFRQVEFAGVLRGTDAPGAAHRLIDFLISPTFQSEIALNLFVYPANTTVPLPPEFTDFAVVPEHPATLDPAAIAANRQSWIETWTDIVLR